MYICLYVYTHTHTTASTLTYTSPITSAGTQHLSSTLSVHVWDCACVRLYICVLVLSLTVTLSMSVVCLFACLGIKCSLLGVSCVYYPSTPEVFAHTHVAATHIDKNTCLQQTQNTMQIFIFSIYTHTYILTYMRDGGELAGKPQ